MLQLSHPISFHSNKADCKPPNDSRQRSQECSKAQLQTAFCLLSSLQAKKGVVRPANREERSVRGRGYRIYAGNFRLAECVVFVCSKVRPYRTRKLEGKKLHKLRASVIVFILFLMLSNFSASCLGVVFSSFFSREGHSLPHLPVPFEMARPLMLSLSFLVCVLWVRTNVSHNERSKRNRPLSPSAQFAMPDFANPCHAQREKEKGKRATYFTSEVASRVRSHSSGGVRESGIVVNVWRLLVLLMMMMRMRMLVLTVRRMLGI